MPRPVDILSKQKIQISESKELGKNVKIKTYKHSLGISWCCLFLLWLPKHNKYNNILSCVTLPYHRLRSQCSSKIRSVSNGSLAAMEETNMFFGNPGPQRSLLQRNRCYKVATAQKDILHHTLIARRCISSRGPGHDAAILLARSIRERQFIT